MELLATIAAPVETELVIKRSQFIGRAAPVTSNDDADAVLAAIRKEHWNANHNCSARVLGITGDSARSSDDGEPSGTAGVPILEVIRRRDLTDVIVIVTRYFGGIMLGAGGLIRAYSSAASAVLDSAQLVQRRRLVSAAIVVPVAEAGRIEYWLRDWVASNDGSLGPTQWGVEAQLEAFLDPALKARFAADLAAISGGTMTAQFGAEQIVDLVN
ncbi:MAG: YigZ family protein [Promicromonosporaceae bacterium]|nr:YigZ family protein [Promicromonosporaceae bacterium]